jgi:hypothetical protein
MINYTASTALQQLVVLLGEWDAAGNTEPIQSQSFSVSRIFIHPQVNTQNLKNNVAIVRLNTFVSFGQTPTIAPACLPNSTIANNVRCWVAGWGVSTFGSNDFSPFQRVMGCGENIL